MKHGTLIPQRIDDKGRLFGYIIPAQWGTADMQWLRTEILQQGQLIIDACAAAMNDLPQVENALNDDVSAEDRAAAQNLCSTTIRYGLIEGRDRTQWLQYLTDSIPNNVTAGFYPFKSRVGKFAAGAQWDATQALGWLGQLRAAISLAQSVRAHATQVGAPQVIPDLDNAINSLKAALAAL